MAPNAPLSPPGPVCRETNQGPQVRDNRAPLGTVSCPQPQTRPEVATATPPPRPHSWLGPAGRWSLNQETEASVSSCDQEGDSVTVERTQEGLGALGLSCGHRWQRRTPPGPHLSLLPASPGRFCLVYTSVILTRAGRVGQQLCPPLPLVTLPVSYPGHGGNTSSGAAVHHGDTDRDAGHPPLAGLRPVTRTSERRTRRLTGRPVPSHAGSLPRAGALRRRCASSLSRMRAPSSEPLA